MQMVEKAWKLLLQIGVEKTRLEVRVSTFPRISIVEGVVPYVPIPFHCDNMTGGLLHSRLSRNVTQ